MFAAAFIAHGLASADSFIECRPLAQAILRRYRTPLPFAAGATPKMVN